MHPPFALCLRRTLQGLLAGSYSLATHLWTISSAQVESNSGIASPPLLYMSAFAPSLPLHVAAAATAVASQGRRGRIKTTSACWRRRAAVPVNMAAATRWIFTEFWQDGSWILHFRCSFLFFFILRNSRRASYCNFLGSWEGDDRLIILLVQLLVLFNWSIVLQFAYVQSSCCSNKPETPKHTVILMINW